VFRVKEVHSSTSDAAGVRDAGTGHGHSEQLGQFSPSSSPRAAGSNSGTPRASGPQVAVLGSPQVRDTAIITLGGGCVVWLCKGAAICCTLAHLLFSTVRSTGPKHHTTCIPCKLAQTLRSQCVAYTGPVELSQQVELVCQLQTTMAAAVPRTALLPTLAKLSLWLAIGLTLIDQSPFRHSP
jgi:hypothetical protein